MNSSGFVKLPECYRILNVAPGVSWADVKRSYYALAKAYHPDRNPGDVFCEERFKSISLAFGTLRRYYEAGGGTEHHEFIPDDSMGRANSHWRRESFFEETDSCGGFPKEEKQKRGSATQQVRRWSQRFLHTLCLYERRWLFLDVNMKITLDSEMARQGGGVKIRRGWETFEVRVPPETVDGTVLRIPGKGDSGVLHRERGDLLIRLEVPRSSRGAEGINETYYQVTLSREDIAARRVFILKTVQGPIRYSLPTNTRNGQSFTLRGHPDPATGSRTRHVVTVLLA